MTLIYLHGLDSSPNAQKAQISADYAAKFGITVLRPDLNRPPDKVVKVVQDLIRANPQAVMVGSSLGGYFANLVSDLTGVPAILLNPSIRPDISFRRFLTDSFKNQPLQDDTVIYTTTGGWQIRFADLAWFEAHPLRIKYPDKIHVLLKMGDELLDAHATRQFYTDKGVQLTAQDGGDHQMSDYGDQVAMVFRWAKQLAAVYNA